MRRWIAIKHRKRNHIRWLVHHDLVLTPHCANLSQFADTIAINVKPHIRFNVQDSLTRLVFAKVCVCVEEVSLICFFIRKAKIIFVSDEINDIIELITHLHQVADRDVSAVSN